MGFFRPISFIVALVFTVVIFHLQGLAILGCSAGGRSDQTSAAAGIEIDAELAGIMSSNTLKSIVSILMTTLVDHFQQNELSETDIATACESDPERVYQQVRSCDVGTAPDVLLDATCLSITTDPATSFRNVRFGGSLLFDGCFLEVGGEPLLLEAGLVNFEVQIDNINAVSDFGACLQQPQSDLCRDIQVVVAVSTSEVEEENFVVIFGPALADMVVGAIFEGTWTPPDPGSGNLWCATTGEALTAVIKVIPPIGESHECREVMTTGSSLVVVDTPLLAQTALIQCGDASPTEPSTPEMRTDEDGDGIFDSGDEDFIIGNNPCTGGQTENCDDNCLNAANADQADGDNDGVGDVCDNCPNDANADQADADSNGTGDVCEPVTECPVVDVTPGSVAFTDSCDEDVDCASDNCCEPGEAGLVPGCNDPGNQCSCRRSCAEDAGIGMGGDCSNLSVVGDGSSGACCMITGDCGGGLSCLQALCECGVPPAAVGVSIADASVAEGDSGTTAMTFTVDLDAPAPIGGVSMDYDSADGTAMVSDSDYSPANDVLNIAEGETFGLIDVFIIGDTDNEPDETLTLTLSNLSATGTFTDDTATGTILNDDAAGGETDYCPTDCLDLPPLSECSSLFGEGLFCQTQNFIELCPNIFPGPTFGIFCGAGNANFTGQQICDAATIVLDTSALTCTLTGGQNCCIP